MTLPTPSRLRLLHDHSLGLAAATRTGGRWCSAGASVLLASLLAGCATISTPLPPWPNPFKSLPAKVPPPVGVGVAAPLSLPPLRSSMGGQSPTKIGPESAGVAAHFPEPTQRYFTPGLSPQRPTFTSNLELAQLLQMLAKTALPGGTQAVLLTPGASQAGVPIHALLLTRVQDTNPDSLAASKRPTVLLIGQQHGDEPASSEALLVLAQELASGQLAPLLDKINVLVLPRANPDGAEAGIRTTANGVDLNQDHLLLQTPEARALAVLVRDFRPTLVLDAQEYNPTESYLAQFGAVAYNDVLLQYGNAAGTPEFLSKAGREWFHPPQVGALQAQALRSDWYQMPVVSASGPARLAMGDATPDSSRNANGLKHAVSAVVATRGVGLGRAYLQRRVHAQITAISSALRTTAERASSLEQVRSFVVRDSMAQACRDQLVLDTASVPQAQDLTLLEPATGAARTQRVTLDSFLQPRATQTRARPCGYWLSTANVDAVERLRLLGVQVLRVAEQGGVVAEVFTPVGDAAATTTAAQGKTPVTLVRSALDVPVGSYYVSLSQPLANLASAALEPDTTYSYFAHQVITGLPEVARVITRPALVFEEAE